MLRNKKNAIRIFRKWEKAVLLETFKIFFNFLTIDFTRYVMRKSEYGKCQIDSIDCLPN
jgi:hypothetical protein